MALQLKCSITKGRKNNKHILLVVSCKIDQGKEAVGTEVSYLLCTAVQGRSAASFTKVFFVLGQQMKLRGGQGVGMNKVVKVTKNNGGYFRERKGRRAEMSSRQCDTSPGG